MSGGGKGRIGDRCLPRYWSSGGVGICPQGLKVAVNYRASEAEANAVVTQIAASGGTAAALGADVSDPSSAATLVAHAEERLGPIDIVVNNAGINTRKPLDQLEPADWDQAIRTNLGSAFYVTQAVLPGMRARAWGRIIMLSSIAAQTGGVIGPHYAASKVGHRPTHSYASLLAKEGITCNAIAPALIDTDMIRSNQAIAPSLIPIGRFGTADEVASVALLLASNGYITGQTINVNGGWYMS